MRGSSVTDALDRILLRGREGLAELRRRAPDWIESGKRMLHAAPSRPAPDLAEAPAQAPRRSRGMSKPDLEAVMQRRAMIARELSALEKMKVEMTAEDEELQVAERVLRRLAQMSGAQAIAYVESEARPLEQVDED